MKKQLLFNENYFLFPCGKIESTERGNRILKPVKNNCGYLQYYLKDRTTNKSKWFKVHRLVAVNFISNPNNYNEVNHIDGNKENNNVDNLEWCTHSQNIIHSYKTRVIKKGIDSHRFGIKATDETKQKQSESKKGESHPKFKGYYCYNGIKYNSAIEASKQTNINSKTIIRHSKANKNGWSFLYYVK